LDSGGKAVPLWKGSLSGPDVLRNWTRAFWGPDALGRIETVRDVLDRAAKLGLEVDLSTGTSQNFSSYADYYRYVSAAKYVLAPSRDWVSPGQVHVDAHITGTVVFSRDHRLFNRMLAPSFMRVDSVAEAMLKIAYLEGRPDVYQELADEARANAREFISFSVSPNLLGLESRTISSAESLEPECLLPLSAEARARLQHVLELEEDAEP
jgi:hypothetical protein